MKKFEIAEKDLFEETINYYDLKIPPQIKDDGWRLPNPDELKTIFSHGLPNIKNDWYMTSEITRDYKNLCIHHGDKREVFRDITESHWGCCYIRLIRDI